MYFRYCYGLCCNFIFVLLIIVFLTFSWHVVSSCILETLRLPCQYCGMGFIKGRYFIWQISFATYHRYFAARLCFGWVGCGAERWICCIAGGGFSVRMTQRMRRPVMAIIVQPCWHFYFYFSCFFIRFCVVKTKSYIPIFSDQIHFIN